MRRNKHCRLDGGGILLSSLDRDGSAIAWAAMWSMRTAEWPWSSRAVSDMEHACGGGAELCGGGALRAGALVADLGHETIG